MLKPIIILNLKAYKEGMNKSLYTILDIVDSVSREYNNIDFAIAPNIIYLLDATKNRKRTLIFAQHADPVPYGAYTGHIPLAAIKDIGVDGVIVNHSERQVTFQVIENVVGMAQRNGLRTCVCGGDIVEIRAISRIKPIYTAFEPPELIGTGRSVSRVMPDILKKSVNIILEESEGKSIPVCGAGISNKTDVEMAFRSGARGILVASAFVKAKDRKSLLMQFAEAIEENI